METTPETSGINWFFGNNLHKESSKTMDKSTIGPPSAPSVRRVSATVDGVELLVGDDGTLLYAGTGDAVRTCFGGSGHVYVHIPLPWKGSVLERVDRIVAGAFVPNPLGRDAVAHLDGDRSNCAAANLVWTDSSLLAARSDPVVRFVGGRPVGVFPSVKAAAEKVGVSQRGIYMCLRGESDSAAGSQWVSTTKEQYLEYERMLADAMVRRERERAADGIETEGV